MRNIKFRAKRIADGGWMTGYLFYFPTPTGAKETYIATFEGNDAFTIKVDPETVGQYIDMVDRHSKEIYEGMKVKEWNKPEVWDVVWDEAVAAFEFVTEDRKHTWMPNFDYVAQAWEIVV